MVADIMETKAPPIMVGIPSLLIKFCLLGVRTPSPHKSIPMDDIFANPQRM